MGWTQEGYLFWGSCETHVILSCHFSTQSKLYCCTFQTVLLHCYVSIVHQMFFFITSLIHCVNSVKDSSSWFKLLNFERFVQRISSVQSFVGNQITSQMFICIFVLLKRTTQLKDVFSWLYFRVHSLFISSQLIKNAISHFFSSLFLFLWGLWFNRGKAVQETLA